jgi:ribosome modulation factor
MKKKIEDQIYHQGTKAARFGKSLTDCPYGILTEEGQSWLKGYHEYNQHVLDDLKKRIEALERIVERKKK